MFISKIEITMQKLFGSIGALKSQLMQRGERQRLQAGCSAALTLANLKGMLKLKIARNLRPAAASLGQRAHRAMESELELVGS